MFHAIYRYTKEQLIYSKGAVPPSDGKPITSTSSETEVSHVTSTSSETDVKHATPTSSETEVKHVTPTSSETEGKPVTPTSSETEVKLSIPSSPDTQVNQNVQYASEDIRFMKTRIKKSNEPLCVIKKKV